MERIQMPEESEEVKLRRQKQWREAAQELARYSVVHDFLKKYHQNLSLVEDHLSLFHREVERSKKCKACRGLTMCTMDLKGMPLELYFSEEGFLDERRTLCRYALAHYQKIKHKANFLMSHLQEADYEVTIEKILQSAHGQPKPYVLACQRIFQLCQSSQEGLLLYGEPGTGKSTLLMAIANSKAMQNQKVAFVKVPLLLSQLKENISNPEYRSIVLSKLYSADVLFLDDFGSELSTPWTRDEVLFPLLDERLMRHKQTFFASNLNLEELYKRYALDTSALNGSAARRLIDRVSALAQSVEVRGESRRPAWS